MMIAYAAAAARPAPNAATSPGVSEGLAALDALSPALAPYLDPVAALIVLGGTLAVTVLRTPLRDLGRAIAALAVLPRRHFRADAQLAQIDALSRIARRHGVLALDKSVIADRDVAAAIAAIVDGASGDDVSAMVEQARRTRFDRHSAAADVWAAAAETAPAMGMVGTLVGLVAMFTRMTDPSAIGGAMAIALLATLYGALVANLVAMPVAARLRRAARIEVMERQRLVAPLAAIAAREAPRPVSFSPQRAGAALEDAA